MPLLPGTWLTAQSFSGFTDDYSSGCAFGAGVDRAYSLAVPAGQRVTVTATADTADAGAPGLTLLTNSADCSARACAASSPPAATGQPSVASYVNSSGATQTIFVVANANGPSDFSILAALTAAPMLTQGGETCATPVTLAAGTTILSTTVGRTSDYALSTTGSCRATGASPDAVYAIDVPGGFKAIVNVTPFSFDPSVNVMTSPATCGPPATCVASSDRSGAGAVETVTFTNRSASLATYPVLIDSNGTASSGNFELSYAVAPSGENCVGAIPITASGLLPNESLVGYQSDLSFVPGTGCQTTSPAQPERVYSVVVPAGQRLSTTVTPAPDGALLVNLVPSTGCTGVTVASCLASGGGATGSPTNVHFTNESAVDQAVFIVVGRAGTAPIGAFSLNVALTTPVAGDLCSLATPLTPGLTVSNQSLSGFDDDYSSGCGFSSFADRVYSVSVPDGRRLTVTLTPTPTTGQAASVALFRSVTECQARTCAAVAPLSPLGVTNVVSYLNISGATETVLVAVDHASYLYPYSLLATLSSAPPLTMGGETCASPVALTAGAPMLSTTVRPHKRVPVPSSVLVRCVWARCGRGFQHHGSAAAAGVGDGEAVRVRPRAQPLEFICELRDRTRPRRGHAGLIVRAPRLRRGGEPPARDDYVQRERDRCDVLGGRRCEDTDSRRAF